MTEDLPSIQETIINLDVLSSIRTERTLIVRASTIDEARKHFDELRNHKEA